MKKTFLAISLLLCALLLCGCRQRVEFSAGKVWEDESEVCIVLQDGETEKLNLMPALKRADLRGSANFEEIFDWAQQHSDVEVLYTVTLPDGTAVENSVTELDLSSLESADYEAAAECLAYLPELEAVSFDKKISAKELSAFCSKYPELSYDCDISACGTNFHSDVRELEFIGADDSLCQELELVLPALDKLSFVELGSDESSPLLSRAAINSLQQARPEADFAYSFELYDKSFSTLSTEMDLKYIQIYDEGAEVKDVLSIMPKLEVLDMDSCGVSDEAMADIRDTYPNVEVIWRVWFGRNYCVRTNVEKILASMPSTGGDITSSNHHGLFYCTKVKYLDLGHNERMEDISFVACMPELEVAILSISDICDVSALANCPKLEFLEIQTSRVSDISALSGLKNLRHLNIGHLFELDDISPIMDLELERLWIGCKTPVPEEQVEEYKRLHPDCSVNTTTDDPHGEGWRYAYGENKGWHPRYTLLVEQFGYDSAAYAFPWKDPLYPRWLY